MERQVKNIGKGSNLYFLLAKALKPKKKNLAKDQVPQIILRQTEFNFSSTFISGFADLVGFKSQENHFPAAFITSMGFSMQLELLVHDEFPHGILGMLHLKNTVKQHKRFKISDVARVDCYFDEIKDHKLGSVYVVKHEIFNAADELLCENTADQLKIHKEREKHTGPKPVYEPLKGESMEWNFPSNLGRRFSKFSKDINPIHLFGFMAKLFGFKRQIVHGMYVANKAFSEAEIYFKDKEQFTFTAEFIKPAFLPAKIDFVLSKEEGKLVYEVQNKEKTKLHFKGEIT